MDLWGPVRTEHANIRELCREILGATNRGGASRGHLLDQLDRELDRHMRAVAATVVPALRRRVETQAQATAMAYEHEAIRRRLDELARSSSMDGRLWTHRFEDLVDALERDFGQADAALASLRNVLGQAEEEELRHAFQREKIAALQAQRWGVPAAMVPRRHGLSNRAVLGLLAAAAGVALAAAWRGSAFRGARRQARPQRGIRRPFTPSRRTPMQAHEMISTHPDVRGSTNDALIRAIEACYSCAQICTSCADACLAEGMVQELRQCIRLDLDCGDVCAATGSVASRRTGSNEPVIRRMLEACETACRLCAEECERHAGMHEHCRICAESCRRCEDACRQARHSMGH